MKPRALFPLLARPMGLAVAAQGAAFLLVPLALMTTLTPSHPDPARAAAAALFFAAIQCLLLGFFCGGAISQAARCSFAWTTPSYRRRLRLEFIAAGVAMAAVVSFLTTAVMAPGVLQVLIGLVVALAALAAGTALTTVPEGSLAFLPLLFAFLALREKPVEWVLRSPGLFTVAALVVAVVCVGAAFSARTFRWALLVGGPSPFFSGTIGGYHSWLDILRSMPWWPAHRGRQARGATDRPAGRTYADTVVRRVLASFGAVTPSKRFLIATMGLWVVAYLFVISRVITARSGAGALDAAWILLPMAGLASSVRMINPSRAALPWSRDEHLVVTWVRDLAKLLWFVLATGPLIVVLGWACGWNAWDSAGAAARAIAGIGIVFPLAQWSTGPPVGGSPGSTGALYLKGFAFTAAFTIAPGWMVRVFPSIAEAAWVQACVLGLLLLASQALHWHFLKRYFERRDLVGESA